MVKETTPSETEWLVMEVIWSSNGDITASEIIQTLKGTLEVSARTIRVLINRLLAKGVIRYEVDQKDSRVYHYYVVKSKEECLAEKQDRFVRNYFGGNSTLAVASFLEKSRLSDEQFLELEQLVEKMKEERGGRGR
ncbi:MAG: BlaI/MecI/CopY family transcriptional regulator [Eubacterium sp.]|jgi:Predicted transcriptional regulator|nr:BlaI/MecI/CopY family transcriptional regulator [Eubacterium sp.]